MAGSPSSRNQNTLLKSFSISGLGVFSGKKTRITCKPSPAGSGVLFRCIDLPHTPEIPAHVANVQSTNRRMVLGTSDVSVQCVEHLLASFRAFNLDNVLVEVEGGEVPICDGSARTFVEEIRKSGITQQDTSLPIRTIAKPIWWSEGEISLVALPSEVLKVSYTLNYPGHPLLEAQFYTFTMTEEGFTKEIASARTFCLYEEIQPLLDKGILGGGGLENSVVIKGKEVLNKDGLRFSDEMVRHKILDLIGDLSLVGFPWLAHIIAIRSGHASHVQLAKKVMNDIRY